MTEIEREQERKRIRDEVSNFVFSLRNRFRETQKQFAERLGISAGMVAFYESGKNIPTLDVFVKLVKISGVIPYQLFGIEEKQCLVIMTEDAEGRITQKVGYVPKNS